MSLSEKDVKNVLDNFGNKILAHKLTYIKKFEKKTSACTLTKFEIDFDAVKGVDINVDMYNDSEVETNEKTVVKPALFASCVAELYHSQTEYYAEGHGLSVGGMLPCGSFNPSGNKNFEQKPAIIACGTVVACEDVTPTAQCYLVSLQILGTLFSVFVEKDVLPSPPQAGNILWDMFYVAGLYAEQTDN